MTIKDDMHFIGKKITTKRKKIGITVEELAQKTLLPVSVVKKAEKGSTLVSFQDYITIFYVLNLIAPEFL